MRKLILVLMVLAVLVTACAQQKAAEPAAPAGGLTPVEETPAPEAPESPVEEPVAETPAEETPAPEEAPAETPAPAATNADEQFFDVKEGDTITYKSQKIIIEDLTNQGNYATMYIDPIRYHLYAVNKPEILNNIEYQIVENNFNTANSIKLRIRPLKLEAGEYLVLKDEIVTVNNVQLTLGAVQVDSRNQESAYVYVGGIEYRVKLGETVNAGTLAVTLKSPFYKQKQYAILKIVPA